MRTFTESELEDILYHFSLLDSTIKFYTDNQDLITTHKMRTLVEQYVQNFITNKPQ